MKELFWILFPIVSIGISLIFAIIYADVWIPFIAGLIKALYRKLKDFYKKKRGGKNKKDDSKDKK